MQRRVKKGDKIDLDGREVEICEATDRLIGQNVFVWTPGVMRRVARRKLRVAMGVHGKWMVLDGRD